MHSANTKSEINYSSMLSNKNGGGGIVMGFGTTSTTSEQYFRMVFMSDEKHKVQDSNEASYTFRKDK